MPQTPSPLRYPGGKTAITDMVSQIMSANKLDNGHYAEPYAGGGGLALSLLFDSKVHYIHLNDIDKAIWAFWYSILNYTDDFIEKIISTDVTIDEWRKQRSIQENKNESNFLDLGFSSFFLNRTNRSGIILKAGVIGGINQQGKYKLGCRFNKGGLIKKIERIKKYKDRIFLYNDDAYSFITKMEKRKENIFFCIDPPYFKKGASLYTDFYSNNDHCKLSKLILSIKKPWLLTYDNVNEIKSLYKTRRNFNFHLNYSAANKRVGTELLVVSKGLKIPKNIKTLFNC